MATSAQELDPLLVGQTAPQTVQNDLKSAGIKVRQGFVRKVYTLLVVQLAMTVIIASQICILAHASGTAEWLKSNEWLLWASILGTFSLMCSMLCCRELVRTFPMNYILLFTFTAFQSIMIGFVSASFSPDSLLLAAGATVMVFVLLTVYATVTETDFTGMGPYIFAGLSALIIFGLVIILLPLFGVPVSVATALYDCLGVLIFSFAIIYDTQLLLGEWGGHKIALSIDEYVFATLNLYMDILNLFLHILSLFGKRS
eukprot:TRINITY_DN29307_c0_g1_i1.p1 TRINITY_DN29307_c0_g1~~TRINITY_DN29307_c0_g1_i1.p1  ORF type:complete len:257 (-),score=38.51 TRINITY_DN29307_c0_g1_i1:121-891(-)